MIMFLATAAWAPLFIHLRRHPGLLMNTTAADRFAGEVVRPATGIAGYIVAVTCSWLSTRSSAWPTRPPRAPAPGPAC